jgi:ABC-2 type transport system permease protein
MQAVARNYLLMLKWNMLSSKPWLAMLFAVQLMMTVGFVIGVGYFFPQMDPNIARYLITGTPTLNLMMMGLVIVPQMIASSRLEGSYDFLLSFPVPRMVFLAADASLYLMMTLPGVILSLVIGSVYHDFTLQVSPLVIPAFLLISMTATFVGYAIALGVPRPQMAMVASQVIVFAIMFFSPVVYPVEQLPGWLKLIHQVLPVRYMADLSRGTLTDLDINLGLAFGITCAWCLVCFAFCYIVMKRRR